VNKVEELRKLLKDKDVRDMIEHSEEITGHLTKPWLRMTI